jgi:sporulation protein YlmC with PRC-barrel domain
MLRSTVLRAVSSLALLAILAGTCPAQEERPKDTRPGDAPAVRVKSILGTKVNIQGGTGVGTVEDVVLTDEGVVDYLIVADTSGKLVTVPWDAAKFDYQKRTATIDIPQDRYRAIPTYTTERYPNFYAPAYRTEVYRYYGLTPGQQRRLERRLERRP